MSESPAVHHFLLCRGAKVRPPARPFNPYTLRGVSYQYPLPAGMGVSRHDPYPAKVLWLFTRFFGGTGSHDFEIEITWTDAPDGEEWVETHGPYTVAFREGDAVRDYLFPVRNALMWGTGHYAIRLLRIGDGELELVGQEYFEAVEP